MKNSSYDSELLTKDLVTLKTSTLKTSTVGPTVIQYSSYVLDETPILFSLLILFEKIKNKKATFSPKEKFHISLDALHVCTVLLEIVTS